MPRSRRTGNGQVWVYERRQTPAGANDYWSRSVTHPDLVLADLVKIFHPRLDAGPRVRVVHAGAGAVAA